MENNNTITQFWKDETISQAKTLALRENTMRHFHSDKPYTEKDEAERVSLVMPRKGICNKCTQSLAGMEHCRGLEMGCACKCYVPRSICLQCNQSGHSFCNKD